MKRIRDWVFTIPFLAAFGLTLGLFEIVARIARLFGLRPMEITMGVMQRLLLWELRITGTKLVVERSEKLEGRTGYVLLSNHQSLIDVPIFGGLLFSNYPKYVAKAELGRWLPSVSFNLTHGGNAVIDREDPRQALRIIKGLGRECQRRNTAVVIFPEGTRSRSGELREFKTSGAITLMKAASDMAVVPTTIDGSWELLAHKLFPIPFGTTIRVRFGDPIARADGDDPRSLLDQARAEIDATLARWRENRQT
ncbi:MAG: 1-acyl-sn-glycerol-3-phosphate acyltransferase [Acidimicrobiia bacterium]|nr:1-acyl-sn-glycerol-3-phosphate acyltransferase [Acidimicrobiia bacterium]